MIGQLDTATLTPELSHIRETSMVEVDSDCPMTVDRLLRRMEVLRQRIAVRWCGVPGAFAGYDQLQIHRDHDGPVGSVTFTCRLIDVGETTHTVEFLASIRCERDGGAPRVLLRGTGRTLHVSVGGKDGYSTADCA